MSVSNTESNIGVLSTTLPTSHIDAFYYFLGSMLSATAMNGPSVGDLLWKTMLSVSRKRKQWLKSRVHYITTLRHVILEAASARGNICVLFE